MVNTSLGFSTFTLTQDVPSEEYSNTTTSHSNFFLALKLESKTFPWRNCGLARSSRESQTPTCLKLRNSILLTKSTFAAIYLIMLAGDINSNPGLLQTVSYRKSKLSLWFFNTVKYCKQR